MIHKPERYKVDSWEKAKALLVQDGAYIRGTGQVYEWMNKRLEAVEAYIAAKELTEEPKSKKKSETA